MADEVNEVKNLSGLKIFELEEIRINEYHPQDDGKGLPTEVHMALRLMGAPPNMLMVMRLKSRRAVDDLVTALCRHRDNVWPERGS